MPVSIHKFGHVNRRSVNHAHGEFVRHMANAHGRHVHSICLLWSPYGIGQTIIFLPCGFYLLSFFPCLISAVGDWMSAILPHMVWP